MHTYLYGNIFLFRGIYDNDQMVCLAMIFYYHNYSYNICTKFVKYLFPNIEDSNNYIIAYGLKVFSSSLKSTLPKVIYCFVHIMRKIYHNLAEIFMINWFRCVLYYKKLVQVGTCENLKTKNIKLSYVSK